MLDRIILYSINNKLLIGLLTLGLIVWGLYETTRLPIDAVPDITNNQVQILTSAPSQSAPDIERLVTFPVEQTMSTIPQIDEIRSFSRFGLSVVTIVFHDDVDVYWARQQVNERLQVAAIQIPPGVGIPELAPITTGLGEIYQYIVRPEKGYESRYDAMELRSIQDWIVRRQLLGIPGVADVASFGGFLKQYEIALDPDRLRSYNLGINEVFTALERNNQNTGGAYIDRKPNAWFIRSEGLINSLDDIGKIVIKSTAGGIPILVRDVGIVRFGHATRYGAMTYNNSGEVVGAVTLMLKGENSSAVVNRVKQRIEQIKKTLPEGVTIEAFLDRSTLVDRAVRTVEKNLVEGALIVIVVLVLFLGNLRAGLIVASVIPLSMLFAISLMNVFGVSGNLMSLGAIDFGLIVDGAVIIVEATMHHLGVRTITARLTQCEMDREVYASASKIRTSAAFGEIIILIVYLPILVLVGIEGKMFRPMAQTVSFAILGAFILSITYVPMMSALFLSKDPKTRPNISDRMMDFFLRLYQPIVERALRMKLLVITGALVLCVVSLIMFSRMGGEFLPTLEEGDFAVETRVLAGSSLTYTIDAASKAAEVLLREFPDEVEEVVGKVGTSEIPTDPMPIEACDVIVVLRDKSQWKKAGSREELAEKMSEALEVIPGVTFGFQQPIQMRFNELMTGVRQDVAVKIFGEDLNVLADLSKQVAKVVTAIDGARDLYVEEVTGLSQIVVDINRDEVARYGLNIETINQTINAAFAGQSAGLVFEQERRFDLTVRLTSQSRNSIEDVRNVFITSLQGNQVPLGQLADVSFRIGPNQIQREDAKRRIVVGFNLRGRDISSAVESLQQQIEKKVDFPPGYYPVYGGQFENLQEAQGRLAVAVPAALFLILILLFFTFGSFKQTLLIFMAIPMAAVGGVFALYLRGMHFSISAGVGFIALFGVAVLNGIVLIAEFNQLRKSGMTDTAEIVKKGTAIRLRPVLMTAAVASLGFLPMALATSAGAEVQKPLATVVIGGLVSSTILTLVVLPCLYIYFERINLGRLRGKFAFVVLFMLAHIVCNKANAQSPVTLQQAIDTAMKNNQAIKAAAFEVEGQRQLKKTSVDLPKTNVSLLYGQYNSFARNDNNLTVTQNIPFTVFGSQHALNESLVVGSEMKKAVTEHELVYRLRQRYFQLSYLQNIHDLLLQQDSLYNRFAKAAALRYETGEANLLERTTAETQRNEVRNVLAKNEADQLSVRSELAVLMNSQSLPLIARTGEQTLSPDAIEQAMTAQTNPSAIYIRQQVEIAKNQKKVEAARAAPEVIVGFFNQTLIGVENTENPAGQVATSSDRFTGFHLGLAVPLWYAPHDGRRKAAEYSRQAAQVSAQHFEQALQGQYAQAYQQYEKNRNSLSYYKSSALPNAELIIKQTQGAFKAGEIGWAEVLLGLQRAMTVKEAYLSTLNEFNQSVITLDYLSGNR